MRPGTQHTLRLSAGIFLLWTLMGLFMFSQGILQKVLSGDPSPVWHFLASWMVGSWLWCVFSPLVWQLGRKFPLGQGRLLRTILIHTVLAVAVSIADLSVEAALLYGLGVFPMVMRSYAAALAFLITIGFHQGMITYG